MKFRKRPVVIEAVQYKAGETLPSTFTREGDEIRYVEDGRLLVMTMEGAMSASPGDWIIRGVRGELYPCKPDIFAATYSPEPEASPRAHEFAGPDIHHDFQHNHSPTVSIREKRPAGPQGDGGRPMTMKIEIKNGDPARVAEVREQEFDVTTPGSEVAREHKSRLGPGEARTYYIHAAKTLLVIENPNG